MEPKLEIKSILLVDDNQTIRTLMKLALTQSFEVYLADSGETCIEIAEAKQPDAILLDVKMPGLDGPATLSRLRSKTQTAKIPIIFVTASVQSQELAEYKNYSVAGIIQKPFDPLELAGLIREICSNAAACQETNHR
ncbi:MAG: response regulator [Candidatus Obscuribacterales bacterium]|nr:response regulator [Candidatus Obscuribacterales bacterium]